MRFQSRFFFGVLCSAAALSSCATFPAQGAHPNDDSVVLPLQTVRLYEGGVGYFERSGSLGTHSAARLPVPASHVDDALKSLIVLSEGGKASVSGLEFSSLLSSGRARSLASLPLAADHPITFGDVLTSFEGTRVKARLAKETVTGTLLQVTALAAKEPSEETDEDEPHVAPEAEPAQFTLSLLTDAGALRRLRTSEVIEVSPLDEAVVARLGVAAVALSDRAAQLERDLQLVAQSDGPIRLGYVAETPVWRTTYRVFLEPQNPKGRLQGWALIHNDTDEPWHKVQVELVNGLPDSFLHPLAAPRYTERSMAEPSEPLSTVPQLAHRTADGIWGDHIPEGESISGIGRGGGGQSYGVGLGSIGTIGHGAGGGSGYGSGASNRIRLGDLAALTPAEGEEQAALFSYRLPNTLNLRAHGSALVPFVDSPIKSERVTWFDNTALGRSALAIENLSRQTLPVGMVTVFEGPGFAGESVLPRLKPGEHAFLEYGTDLDVELTRTNDKRTEQTVQLYVDGDALERHYLLTSDDSVELENRSGSARVIQMVLGIPSNSKVTGQDRLTFDKERGGAIAVFDAKSSSKRVVQLQTVVARMQRIDIAKLTRTEVSGLAMDEQLPGNTKQTLTEALPLFDAIEASAKRLKELEEQKNVLKAEQEQWYQHERKLSAGNKEDTENPIRARIVQLEDRITEVDAKLREAQVPHETAVARLREKLSVLTPPPEEEEG